MLKNLERAGHGLVSVAGLAYLFLPTNTKLGILADEVLFVVLSGFYIAYVMTRGIR